MSKLKDAKFENGYLVLEIKSSRMTMRIAIEEVGKWACDHDDWESDCGRCWLCGLPRTGTCPPLNWALPKHE